MNKSKLSIIKIDLDFNIEQLIKDEVSTISKSTNNLIEQSIANAQLVQQVKDKKTKEKEDASLKQHTALTTIYHKLLDKLSEGVPASTIYEMATDIASSPSGFTLKFKGFLNDKGNPYIIQKIKKNGTQYFILIPYNTKS